MDRERLGRVVYGQLLCGQPEGWRHLVQVRSGRPRAARARGWRAAAPRRSCCNARASARTGALRPTCVRVPAPLASPLPRACRLANRIKPGSVPRINDPATMPFKKMENIANYLKAVRALGVKEFEMFGTPDLFEEKNVTGVRAERDA